MYSFNRHSLQKYFDNFYSTISKLIRMFRMRTRILFEYFFIPSNLRCPLCYSFRLKTVILSFSFTSIRLYFSQRRFTELIQLPMRLLHICNSFPHWISSTMFFPFSNFKLHRIQHFTRQMCQMRYWFLFGSRWNELFSESSGYCQLSYT